MKKYSIALFFKQKKILNVFLIILSFQFSSKAQDSTTAADSSESGGISLYQAAAITGAYYAASIIVLSNTWYKGRKTVPFHFYNDGCAYMQVDKFGHAFGSYFYSYVGYHGLRSLGFSKTQSMLYGGSLGFVLQLPIEIMDGIHEGWGFSWGDIAANATGSVIVIGQEILFDEQLVKFKFSCWESEYSRKANGYLGNTTAERILNDYNGQTYWLSMPVNKLISKEVVPSWLNIAVGYGANGMYGEYENISSHNGALIPETKRYRQFLLSLDIDWTKIETESSILKVILQGLTFIKLPFPAIEYNTLGNFKLHWIYY